MSSAELETTTSSTLGFEFDDEEARVIEMGALLYDGER